VPAASSILSLNPFLDKKGLIKACGRIRASDSLRYDERHPIILPYECTLSRLLVKFTHLISLYGGNQLVVRLTRSRYWVPRIKNLVKAVVNSCKICVIHKMRLQVQMMGSFPKERVSFSRPFTFSAMDYAGPFDIKNNEKRYSRVPRLSDTLYSANGTKGKWRYASSKARLKCAIKC